MLQLPPRLPRQQGLSTSVCSQHVCAQHTSAIGVHDSNLLFFDMLAMPSGIGLRLARSLCRCKGISVVACRGNHCCIMS